MAGFKRFKHVLMIIKLIQLIRFILAKIIVTWNFFINLSVFLAFIDSTAEESDRKQGERGRVTGNREREGE